MARAEAALALLCAASAPSPARAWGERGHRMIAEIAARLAADRVEGQLRGAPYAALLRRKAGELGYLAYIPDSHWRALDAAAVAANGPTHYLHADRLPIPLSELPLRFSEAARRLHGRPGANGQPLDLRENGTLPWRAQQLYQGMVEAFAEAARSPAGTPENAAAARRALTSGGLLAHFIGDASMPYHAVADFDGVATGNAGIHEYFERDLLDAQDPRLELEAHQLARWLLSEAKRPPEAPAAARLTRELLERGRERLAATARADADSALSPGTPGDAGRPPRRRPPAGAKRALKREAARRLADSAAALARLWTSAWEEGGRPGLSEADALPYAHAPPFVPPDYLRELNP